MNLTEILKDASLQNHSWMADGLTRPGEFTFDPEAHDVKNPNNTKPELEMEWGYGGMEPIFMEDPSAGEVRRNLPPDAVEDAGEVIRFARDMMNRGHSREFVAKAITSSFPMRTLARATDELRSLFSLDGIVGRIAVDARGYDSCKDALKAAARSPYKRFIKYVIGCDCGDPQMIHDHRDGGLVASDDVGFDGFLKEDERRPYEASLRPHCRSTMLPILAGMGDLDESEMDSTLIDLMNLTNLPESIVEEDAGRTPLARVRDAFRAIDRMAAKARAAAYDEQPDASEFVVRMADNEVEIDAPARPPIELDDTRAAKVELDVIEFEGIDVDMAQGMPGIFAGVDEISLDDVVEPVSALDVDTRYQMVVE